MAGSALMSLGVKALSANYAALATTGHNIANANVAGYSRQQAEFVTAPGQFTGAGYFGKGVDVATVTRAHDAFLTREAATAKSLAAMDGTRLDLLRRLESVFPGGESGLGHAAAQFLNAMTDLAARPDDPATRQVVLARAGDAAAAFAAAGTQLDTLQLGVKEDLGVQVAEVNRLAASVAELNQRIAAVVGLGQPPNDLLDERDRLLARISERLQISTIDAGDGTVSVFFGGGQRLVLGTQVQTLSVQPDPADSSRAALGVSDNGFVRIVGEAELGGGSIAGLLRFQSRDLVDARTMLGQIAAALAGAVNAQQMLGLDLRNPPGAGAPIFAVGAPQALANANNAVDAGGAFVGRVTLAVSDAAQLAASEYDLRADPSGVPGVWQLTRLADGLVRTIASGDVVDGMRIDIGPPAPAAGDRFLLQPVSRAANDMKRVLDDPRGIAAASPLTASADRANTGTASVAALTVVDPSVDPERSATITFSGAGGAYAWELRDRTTNALLGSGTGTWQAGTPIALNGFELELAGVPAAGDAFRIAKTAYPAVNNGNARAFVALREAPIVGVGMSGSGGTSLTDAYASALASVGVRVQGANSAAQTSAAVATQAEALRSAKSGVDLDEEAARLIQFQQSYQAAAKILQVAQGIFDTLLDAAGA